MPGNPAICPSCGQVTCRKIAPRWPSSSILPKSVDAPGCYSCQANGSFNPQTALRNLLQRRGYASLDAVQKESREQGREEGELALTLRLVERAIGSVSDNDSQRIRQLDPSGLTLLIEALADIHEPTELTTWLERSALYND